MNADQRRRAVDKISRESSQATDLVALWGATTEVLDDAVPYYWTPCFYTMDPASLLVTSHFHHGLDEFPAEWLEWEYDGQDIHSLIDVALSASGVSTLHDLTGGDPTGTRRWQENIKLGGDQEMIARLRTSSGETWGAVGLYREPERPLFDEDDRRFLTAISAPLAQGVRRALLFGEAADPEWSDSPGLIIFDENLSVESFSPGAEGWLGRLSGSLARLPQPLRAVAAAGLHGVPKPDGAMARVLSTDGSWLVLHGTPLINNGIRRVAVIMEPADPDRILPLLMSAYGLTERERQVVGLVIGGLPTRQIASKLFVSTNTVQQHLKKIFEKVGVTSRGDLTARLFFTHYEPRFRDNEVRVSTGKSMRGGPARPDGGAA